MLAHDGTSAMEVTGVDVRNALKTALAELEYEVASDTYATRGELYIKGAGDLAGAVFEFHTSPEEAFERMYQGSWTEGLPPRFAVLPAGAAESPSFEMLEQARIIPLLYDVRNGAVEFSDMAAVQRHVPARPE